MYHPWRRLSEMPRIDVLWTDLPDDLIAETDGLTVIEMDRRLMQVDRRCALDHELAHIDLGHIRGCNGREETAARRLSARRLLPLSCLTTALAYTTDLEYAAWDLWVTRDVLDDRLDSLTEAERAAIMDATEHHRQWA